MFAFLFGLFVYLCMLLTLQLKKHLSDINRDSWLHPFSTVLWLTQMATACIVFVVIWCLDRKSPQGYYHVLKGSDEDAFTLLGKLAFCTVIRNYQGGSVAEWFRALVL